MGKNKTPTNAFFYFFNELKDKQKRPITSKQAVEMASPLWNKMTMEQRRPYEEKANLAKRNRVKETNAGESIDLLMQEENVKKWREEKVKTEIENMIKVANSNGTLADTNFYLFHMNYFFYHELENKYYPAEVGLGKFNLRTGILMEDVYHSNVYPGKFPIGYKRTAQAKAEETHKLPTEFGSKNNIKEVLEELIHINKDQSPFFVLEKEVFIVDKMMQDMCAECEMDNYFNIYPLDHLFYVLKNAVHGPEKKVWPVFTLSTITLEKDTYEMCEEIACEYHKVVERQANCSKSKIIQRAYVICDNCTPWLSIQLIPGQHVPSHADIASAPLPNLTSALSNINISKNTSAARGKNSTAASSRSNISTAAAAKVTSTAYDSDLNSYHGFESTDSQAGEEDEEPWAFPKRCVRLRKNSQLPGAEENLTAPSASQSQPTQSEPLSLDMSQLMIRSPYLPGRRPGDTSEVGFRGRGRGKLRQRPQ